MDFLGYAGDSFWRGIEWLGCDTWFRGIIDRKLELVYIHWTVLLAFLIANGLAVLVLVQRVRELRCIMRLWVTVCLSLYCLIVGLFFFNSLFFSHDMLYWPPRMFVPSMLRSLIAAVVPVWFLYVMSAADREMAKVPTRVYLALIPVLHSLMTIIYLVNPYHATE